MDTVISIEGLGKQYRVGGAGPRYRTLRDTLADMVRAPLRRGGDEGQFWALRDLSFQIGRGEVVGIVGRNGAGKSTLLKILSRITGPTVGRIRLRGRVGTLLEVGTGFHPELSGRENIFLNGAILGMHRSETARKFDEIVDFAEVERFIDTPVKHYSSGMYLRLAFAVAAHLEPEILIVDEVLAVGDATFQKKCLGKMGDVARAGRTVLFVSHNMGAIRGLCQRAIWLDKGGVVADGAVFEVVDRYLQTSFDPALVRIDLRETPRTGGMGRRMKVNGITFNDGAVIQHGEPLRATFSFTASAECDSVALGFGFSTLDGVRILSVDSDVGAERRDLPAGASGTATVVLPRLDLQPGHYALDVGARSGDNSALDYMPSCAQIEVLPGPSTPSVIIRDTGGVRSPGAWEWDNAA